MVTKEVTTVNTGAMTQKKAMYLLKTVWPQAPDAEVVKAAMICATYALNPLLRQVSLIKFKNKTGTDNWVTVLGIKASRNIALGTGHHWSYIDGPRVMTEAEQTTIFGQPDPDKIWAITRIRDAKNNEYPGYGFWPRSSGVYGEDKGNSPLNMAFIRSERNALDKMAPGELPNAEVSDESFIPIQDVRQAIEEGKEESHAEAQHDIDTLWDKPDFTVDRDWLRESLRELNWLSVITDYLVPTFHVTGAKVTECLTQMNVPQQKQFCDEVARRLKATGK
jgi:hypothetical protein